jgi:hypothetical protein
VTDPLDFSNAAMHARPTRGTGRPSKGYYRDGTRVPSVTTVLGQVNAKGDRLLRWIHGQGAKGVPFGAERDRKATIGKTVHAAAERLWLGQPPAAALYGALRDEGQGLDQDSQDQVHIAFDGVVSWWRQAGLRPLEVEVARVSRHGFGGTYDLLAEDVAGRLVVADLKTSGAVYGSYWAQLGAYALLVEEHRGRLPDVVQVVRCDVKGDVEAPRRFEVRELGGAFLAALEWYRARKRLGLE